MFRILAQGCEATLGSMQVNHRTLKEFRKGEVTIPQSFQDWLCIDGLSQGSFANPGLYCETPLVFSIEYQFATTS